MLSTGSYLLGKDLNICVVRNVFMSIYAQNASDFVF